MHQGVAGYTCTLAQKCCLLNKAAKANQHKLVQGPDFLNKNFQKETKANCLKNRYGADYEEATLIYTSKKESYAVY